MSTSSKVDYNLYQFTLLTILLWYCCNKYYKDCGTYRFNGYLSSNTCTFSETLSADRTAIASGSISIA